MITVKAYESCIRYIEKFWSKITFSFPKGQGIHIGLPNEFVAPSERFFGKDQFYWDSYFIILGLVVSGKAELAKGMVDNLIYLQKKYGIIPSRNRLYNLGISQPPFLTSMALEVHAVLKSKAWLKKAAEAAEGELQNYWKDGAHQYVEKLSRYCDHFWVHDAAEHESGWDMTSRFYERCLDFLPIDLNSCLYKYETDLADIYALLGQSAKEKMFRRQAQSRKKKMNELMWNENKRFFFDFDFKDKQQSSFYSLAGFYPLWARLATADQAAKCVKALEKFEQEGGLVNTQQEGISEEPKQWDWPNGWANQHYIVVQGLLNYGYAKEARRIAEKWLNLNKKIFLKTGKFWERYDVITGQIPKDGRYPLQTGFGWTNGVFLRLISLFAEQGTAPSKIGKNLVSSSYEHV